MDDIKNEMTFGMISKVMVNASEVRWDLRGLSFQKDKVGFRILMIGVINFDGQIFMLGGRCSAFV